MIERSLSIGADGDTKELVRSLSNGTVGDTKEIVRSCKGVFKNRIRRRSQEVFKELKHSTRRRHLGVRKEFTIEAIGLFRSQKEVKK